MAQLLKNKKPNGGLDYTRGMEENNPQQTQDQALNCLDENGRYPQAANVVMPELTLAEVESLKANTGLDGKQKDNCSDLETILCSIKQDVDAVANGGTMVVSPNEDSKCNDNEDPTLASMWSRILRYGQAVGAILCAYDPYIATLLKTGKYPQILMGAVQEGGYPQWVNPDDYPAAGSSRPVASEGVIKGVKDAILSVWHLWEEEPRFDYFADTLNDEEDKFNLETQTEEYGALEGDRALVAKDGDLTSLLYVYDGTNWVFEKQFTLEDDMLTNFATTHIEKGHYATHGMYYFDGTWQMIDADLGDLGSVIEELESVYNVAVKSADPDTRFVLTTRPTVAEAQKVPCTEGIQTIVLVTG